MPHYRKGTFNLPKYSHQSTRGARAAYERYYKIGPWPYDDSYLRTLAGECTTCPELLNAMRENHVVEPSA